MSKFDSCKNENDESQLIKKKHVSIINESLNYRISYDDLIIKKAFINISILNDGEEILKPNNIKIEILIDNSERDFPLKINSRIIFGFLNIKEKRDLIFPIEIKKNYSSEQLKGSIYNLIAMVNIDNYPINSKKIDIEIY